MKYHVYLYCAENVIKFTYTDYDSVQNLIGYMVEGSPCVKFMISQEEVK